MTDLTIDLRSRAGLQADIDAAPFHQLMGYRLNVLDAEEGYLEMHLPYGAQLLRMKNSEQIHGGAIAALIDVAGTYALVAHLNKRIPTIDLRIDYLRPAAGELIAKASVRRAGRSVGSVDVEVYDITGRLIALGRGLFSTR